MGDEFLKGEDQEPHSFDNEEEQLYGSEIDDAKQENENLLDKQRLFKKRSLLSFSSNL